MKKTTDGDNNYKTKISFSCPYPSLFGNYPYISFIRLFTYHSSHVFTLLINIWLASSLIAIIVLLNLYIFLSFIPLPSVQFLLTHVKFYTTSFSLPLSLYLSSLIPETLLGTRFLCVI